MANKSRPKQLSFRVSEEEYQQLQEKISKSGKNHQMVSSDRGQMIKAAIPYLPPKGQQIFSVYEKAVEFINTVSVFSKRSSGSDLCAMSMPDQNPVDIVNDIRSFCYGPSRDKLNQMVNMMAMVQMLQDVYKRQ